MLEEWINTDADLWGMFQPYYHLLSGRTAFGITDSIEMYAAPRKGKVRFHEPSDSQLPKLFQFPWHDVVTRGIAAPPGWGASPSLGTVPPPPPVLPLSSSRFLLY